MNARQRLKYYIKEYLKVHMFKRDNNLLEQDDDDEESININLDPEEEKPEQAPEPENKPEPEQPKEPEQAPKPEPEKPQPEQPKEPPNPNKPVEITIEQAAALIRGTKGKIFTALVTKKDGEERVFNARLGVKKFLRGGSLKYNPDDHGLIPIFDIQKRAYRMININGIKSLKIRGYIFKIK